MDFSHFSSKLPLETDSSGVVRVGKTRVTLDVMIGAFKNGFTSEEIVLQFPVLDIGDVYLIIGFYLKNQTSVEQYLELQHVETAAIRKTLELKLPTSNVRQRLLARQSALQTAAP